MTHPTADPLTLCNACGAATANPNDPAGSCGECRATPTVDTTMTDPTAPATPTTDDDANAETLPAAVALNRQFIRYERHWSRKHRGAIGETHHLESMRDLDQFAATLDAAARIWQEEQEAVRVRIAERIREDVPGADNDTLAAAVESGDFTMMACEQRAFCRTPQLPATGPCGDRGQYPVCLGMSIDQE